MNYQVMAAAIGSGATSTQQTAVDGQSSTAERGTLVLYLLAMLKCSTVRGKLTNREFNGYELCWYRSRFKGFL
jgi:hypothetical protein